MIPAAASITFGASVDCKMTWSNSPVKSIGKALNLLTVVYVGLLRLLKMQLELEHQQKCLAGTNSYAVVSPTWQQMQQSLTVPLILPQKNSFEGTFIRNCSKPSSSQLSSSKLRVQPFISTYFKALVNCVTSIKFINHFNLSTTACLLFSYFQILRSFCACFASNC